MDETRIDAKTPAHIFAYKAFRGIFIASPESSPIRPQQQHFEHDDKENTPTPRRGSRFTTSPTKTKRKDTDFDLEVNNVAISLTPKRQKIAQASPVKSCIKGRNGQTPRREATVTFKDLRVSISPELARQVQQPDFSVVKLTAKTEAVIPVSKNVVKERPVSKGSEGAKKSDVAITVYNEVLDAYKTQTEKEIRRLIKYGQKWKDQARKQETKNEELEAMVAELKRENQRLSKMLAQKEETDKLERHKSLTQSRQTDNEEIPGRRDAKKLAEPSRRSFHVRPVEPDETLNLEAKVEKAYGPRTDLKQNTAPSRSVRQEPKAENSEDELPMSASPPIKTRDRGADKQPVSSSKISASKLSSVQPRTSSSTTASLPKKPNTIKVDLPVRSASDSTVSDDQEARRAAARARLAARRADRLASTANVSVNPKSVSKPEGSELKEGEESQVDWAGL